MVMVMMIKINKQCGAFIPDCREIVEMSPCDCVIL